MLKKFNTLSLSFLFLMFVLAWGTTTAFAAETNIYNQSFVMTANNGLTFSNLDDIKPGDRLESNVIDSEGNPATIAVECVDLSSSTKATLPGYGYSIVYKGSNTHIKCQFIMIVSKNQVIGVVCPSIATIGCTYSNLSLSMTHQFGMLSCKIKFVNKDVPFFLKGIVANNKIIILWSKI